MAAARVVQGVPAHPACPAALAAPRAEQPAQAVPEGRLEVGVRLAARALPVEPERPVAGRLAERALAAAKFLAREFPGAHKQQAMRPRPHSTLYDERGPGEEKHCLRPNCGRKQ
jgi:hypothetical protein